MKLIDRLKSLIDAGFSSIWISTWEPSEVVKEILEGREENWAVAEWDYVQGIVGREGCDSIGKSQEPVAPLTCYLSRTPQEEKIQIVLLHNLHMFFNSSKVTQAVINAAQAGKATQTFYVVLSHGKDLPPELEKVFVVLEHPLPNEEELERLMEEVSEGQPATGEIVSAARGMTRKQAEDAYALSMVENEGKVVASTIWDLKRSWVNDKGYMSFSRGGPGFEAIEGLSNLKWFAKNILRHDNHTPSKGLMLLGPAGTGKSQWAKCLGNETGRPTLTLDFGALYAKHVGDTEKNIREALTTADAMGKVILFVDEVEKALAGVNSDGDSGVAARAFGTFLTWLSDREDKKSEVFTVMTSNDISKLPPEFSRAERHDAIFFIDLPNDVERARIWCLYEDKYQIPEKHRYNTKQFADKGYSGAEIKSCCRLAKSMDCSVLEASEYVIPVSVTAREKIQALRDWAKGRCISASDEGPYTGENAPTYEAAPKRKVNVSKKQSAQS